MTQILPIFAATYRYFWRTMQGAAAAITSRAGLTLTFDFVDPKGALEYDFKDPKSAVFYDFVDPKGAYEFDFNQIEKVT